MWSRGYDHFVMRQAKDGVSYGPGALWLAVSAESRAQVDQVHAELRDAGAQILQPPKELDYFAPGYYSVGFRDPDGVPIEVVHRWDDLPDLPDAEQVRVARPRRQPRGYFIKPQAGTPPYPALFLLHGFAGHAQTWPASPAAPRPMATPPLPVAARWLGSEGESGSGLRQPLDVLAAIVLAGQATAGRPRAHRRWLERRWVDSGAAHGRPQAADQGRASYFAPTDLARWRDANRSSATTLTI